jgi:hypothetical protein
MLQITVKKYARFFCGGTYSADERTVALVYRYGFWVLHNGGYQFE